MIETGFVDIHSHIIPNVDDGSASMDRSLEMIRFAYDEGVRMMYATPHFGIRNPKYDWQKAESQFEILSEKTKALYSDMVLRFGAELYCGPGMLSGLADGFAHTMSQFNHVMVEFSSTADGDEIFHGCRSLIREGYLPILAHVERYRNAFRKVRDVAEMIDQGVIIQMNTASVLSEEVLFQLMPELKSRYDDDLFFERLRRRKAANEQLKFCHHLIREGLVTFMSTDCHDMIGRRPLVRVAYETVTELAGEAAADALFRDNALSLLG